MQCLDFRRQAGADPNCRDAAFEAHVAQCAACEAHLREQREFDARILRALRFDVPLPEQAAAPRRNRRWLAFAASLVVAVGLGSGIYLSSTTQSFAAAVVEHVQHESQSLDPGLGAVEIARLADVMGRSGATLDAAVGTISYARTCFFRGHFVPHLVVRSEHGPVTVLVLPDEHVQRAMPIDEGGFHGRILPTEHGSIALVGTSDEAIDEVRQKFLTAMRWGD